MPSHQQSTFSSGKYGTVSSSPSSIGFPPNTTFTVLVYISLEIFLCLQTIMLKENTLFITKIKSEKQHMNWKTLFENKYYTYRKIYIFLTQWNLSFRWNISSQICAVQTFHTAITKCFIHSYHVSTRLLSSPG